MNLQDGLDQLYVAANLGPASAGRVVLETRADPHITVEVTEAFAHGHRSVQEKDGGCEGTSTSRGRCECSTPTTGSPALRFVVETITWKLWTCSSRQGLTL